MHQHMNVLTLGVADVARSRDFYVGGLGWHATLLVEGEVMFLQVGGGVLLAFWSLDAMAREAGPTAAPVVGGTRAAITLGHNVPDETEVDAVLTAAVEAGGALLVDGARRAWGGYSGYFADPDGYRWEIVHNPGLVVHPDGRVTFDPS
ncbi:VOC family protein [Rhodococcus sp. NPDC058505]|uniref:VOC family protein n=1 Tax=unclassified Rhodococcus (in: high G+C Gram-positive bacteria) TaxID=192944 RepID=UPI003659E405